MQICKGKVSSQSENKVIKSVQIFQSCTDWAILNEFDAGSSEAGN